MTKSPNSQGYLAEDPAGLYQGSPSWGINTTNTGWIEFGRPKLYKLPVTDVRDDNTYSATALVKLYGESTDGNALGVTLAYFDANQNRISGWRDMMVVSSASTRNVWMLVKGEDCKVPDNAVYVGLQFQANNISGTVKGVITHPMITSGPTIGPYTESTSDLATQADMTVLSNDINLRVKKGDVVNQLNIDAGGALLSTSGNSTKIVFSSPNIIFDSNNPVQIPNANIPGTLTGKTIEFGTITATTNIKGADIEAPIIHSPSGSFKLDGNSGDIIGASIHSADNAWGITREGKIHGTAITASVMDISGDGMGPDFDASNVTPDTTQGIYSRYKYTTSAGYDVTRFGRQIYKNGYLVINGDTFLNRTIGDWSADGGGKYVYDTMYEAHAIKLRAYNYTGSNVQTDNPSAVMGRIDSRLDIQPSAITMGRDWSVGNPNILIDGGGLLKVGTIATNGGHSMGTTDGSDMYFLKMNNDATSTHDPISIHVKKLFQSSLLSLKTDIKPVDPNAALEAIDSTDFMSYHFKNDKSNEPVSISPILDDINPIPKYSTPDIFKSADGTGRNDGNILGYTALAVKALYAKIKDLTDKVNKLEGVN